MSVEVRSSHAHQGEDVRIKEEYYVEDPRKALQEKRQENQEEPEGGDKKDRKKKNKKGKNKRPPPIRFDRKSRLCPILVDLRPGQETPKCLFPNCAFIHDTKAYYQDKGDDLGETCYVYDNYGICPRGVTCRYGKKHLEVTETDVRNLENKELTDKLKGVTRESNHLSKDLQNLLRKKKIDFGACDKLVDKIFAQREAAMAKKEETAKNGGNKEKQGASGQDKKAGAEENGDKKGEKTEDEPQAKKAKVEESSEEKKVEPEVEKTKVEVEEGIEVNPPEKKKVDWSNKLYLAPLTTVGNMPFRRICKKFGADITCGEMAMGLQLLQGHQPEWALVQRHSSEDFFGIQLCGNSPQQMARVAQLVEEHIDCDFVDINMGCPIDLVYTRGMGSGLMGRKKPLEIMVRAMSKVLTRPLTVKMRTGIYMDKRIAHDMIPLVREWGADMVTLHGRSREQRYIKLADWNYVRECREVARPMPLYGNGDLINYEDYNRHKEETGVDGVMLARGALIKPWVFREIKEQRHWDITASERLEMVRDFANYGLDHWGSDSKGVETTRRFLLEWLSFLHRYVPHGILTHPPQRINQRLPHYKGRDDMETLLSSPNCLDWIKITEMFLGKVPDAFSFEPKHKAHSY